MEYHRRSIRLIDYDYSNNGYYFVTVCCQNRKNIFGEIDVGAGLVPALVENKMILNDVGIMVEKIVLDYFNKIKLIELDEYIIMPDHIHMIVMIKNQFNKNIMNEIDHIMNDKINNGMDIEINNGMDIEINNGG